MRGSNRYLLGERIGAGGMAEVFRAWTIDGVGRRTAPVVIKRILPHLSADAEYIQMFMDEARIAAHLNHPNIVKLLDLGRMDGQLFLALELVEGADLEKLLHRARHVGVKLPLAISTFVVMEVLRALHHAHQGATRDGRALGLVHRDVSPANILVSRHGEVKLSDFGIAKASVRAGRTVAGTMKGNTLYMAPEQVMAGAVDCRTDLYGAGLLLLTLLAGHHPYEAMPLGMRIDSIIKGELPRLAEIAPEVPEALHAVVLRATQLDPRGRYENAAAFLDALARTNAALGLSATPRDLANVFIHLGAAGASAAAPAASSIVGRLDPLISASIVEPTPLPQPVQAFATYTGPLNQWGADDDGEATPLQAAVFADEPTPSWSWNVDRTFVESHSLIAKATTEAEPVPLTAARLIAQLQEAEPTAIVARGNETADDTGEGTPAVAVVLPPRTQIGPPAIPPIVLRGHRQAVASLATIGKGALAISASHDQTLRLWEVASRQECGLLRGHRAAVTSVAVSANGSLALSGSRDRTVRLWRLADWTEARVMEGHEGWIFAVAMDGLARRAVSAGMDRAIRVWDLALGECSRCMWGHADTISALALFDDGRRALSGSYDRTVKLWDVERGNELASLECENSVRALAVSPNGTRALSGGADTQVMVWDLERGLAVGRYTGHLEPVVAVAFSPDGRMAISGSYDGSARLWDPDTGATRQIFPGSEPVMSVAFSPDGAYALAGRADGTIELLGLGSN